MLKQYTPPKIVSDSSTNEAVPLAFFSAATAAAALVGAAIGAVATAKALGDITDQCKSIACQEISGLCA
ncbi:hypothetical protein [Chromatium okenii]|uniref:hypothetical protein n=1 Tax=Chromatium okenii TaxID=61644 RepID=UPI0026F0DB36|nr:hypothetical protein [Chromatium okenii]MBV5308179.1 hypothetical protein [Chromatium okenii]